MPRDPRIQDAATKAAEFNKGRSFGMVNAYKCGEGHLLVTIDREPGTTPFTIECPACRALNVKPKRPSFYQFGEMTSACYRVPQDLVPTYEWYRPDTVKGLSYSVIEHVLNGGLMLRKIDP